MMFKHSLARCTPVGSILADPPADLAAAIRRRIEHAPRGHDSHLTVFVVSGLLYAVRSTSQLAANAQRDPRNLVGVYTFRARTDDIADDIATWRVIEGRKAA